jgi:hypothetical protein
MHDDASPLEACMPIEDSHETAMAIAKPASEDCPAGEHPQSVSVAVADSVAVDAEGNRFSVRNPAGDDETGDDPAGDDPAGDDPAGDDAAGDDPAGDDPAGDDETGDDETGDHALSEDPAGDEAASEDSVALALVAGNAGEIVVEIAAALLGDGSAQRRGPGNFRIREGTSGRGAKPATRTSTCFVDLPDASVSSSR